MIPTEKLVNEIYEQGFTIIKGALDENTVTTLKTRLQKIINKKLSDPNYPSGDFGYVANLQNEDVYFIKTMFNHPIVKLVLMELLNDRWYRAIPQDKPNYIFRGMRTRLKEKKPLHMHIDSFMPGSGKVPWLLQVSLILENQTLDNGCTLFVPGSHRSDIYAPKDAIKDAVPAISRAGDIVIWDGRIWHATAPNPNHHSRLAIWSGFSRWWVKQPHDYTETLPDDIYQQLTDEEKSVIGFCSIPPLDEFDPRNDNDTKSGYEVLPKVAPSMMKGCKNGY